MARRFRDDAESLLGPDEGQMLLREYVGGEWKERWHRPELATPVASEPPPPVTNCAARAWPAAACSGWASREQTACSSPEP